MPEVLKFTFSSPCVFIGVAFLIWLTLDGIATIVRAVRKGKR